MDDVDLDRLLDRIEALPSDWHGVGSVSPKALRAIARHVRSMGSLQHSVETGSGKTTLLFSHLSSDHLTFAIDEGGSISQVRQSPLLNAGTVTFIEGLTQATLPAYPFTRLVQLALIDGPHGYPFPDLEYFYLYPRVEPGGLLLVDDIKIPTIRRMFEIIKADDMFTLLEVVDDNLSFFRRTEAPCVSLTSDSWWRQGYNRPYWDQLLHPPVPRTPLAHRLVSRLTPGSVKRIFPRWFKERIAKALGVRSE